MKICRKCNRTYTDSIDFCFRDGKPLSYINESELESPSYNEPPTASANDPVNNLEEKSALKEQSSTDQPISPVISKTTTKLPTITNIDEAPPPWDMQLDCNPLLLTTAELPLVAPEPLEIVELSTKVQRPLQKEEQHREEQLVPVGNETVFASQGDNQSASDIEGESALIVVTPIIITPIPLTCRITEGSLLEPAIYEDSWPAPPLEDIENDPSQHAIYAEDNIPIPPIGEDEYADNSTTIFQIYPSYKNKILLQKKIQQTQDELNFVQKEFNTSTHEKKKPKKSIPFAYYGILLISAIAFLVCIFILWNIIIKI